MYANQHYSRLLRPGSAQDGPPYPKPGMWHVLARHATLDDAIAGMGRILSPILDGGYQPSGTKRDQAEYRIVKYDVNGRILNVYFADGTEILLTAEHRKQLREQRLPLAA